MGHQYSLTRSYHGNFNLDRKQGYGQMYYDDGRTFMGYYHSGKQHGIGIQIDDKKDRKYGLWEHGTNIKWFKAPEVAEIN